MYSIGYAGYYGISLMAASYDVLFISILAHAAQFAFLAVVENPHIEKTYNPPPPRMRAESMKSEISNPEVADAPREAPVPVHNLLGFKNLDLFRTVDYSVLLLLGYLIAFTFVTPSTRMAGSLRSTCATLALVVFRRAGYNPDPAVRGEDVHETLCKVW